MKKHMILGCMAALLISPLQTFASCKVDVSPHHWDSKISADSVEFICKTLICGGPQYILRFGDNGIEGETAVADKQKLPLSFDELDGRRVTSSHLRQYRINETYFGAQRILDFHSEGVIEAQVMKNFNLLKASAQCG